jgi:glutaminyl-tRNA synthetase
LYDWFIENLEIYPSRQIEFARMNVEYLITSKRRLLKLVQGGYVDGWDDPRMPTIAGMRRRGYTGKALRTFADKAGVAKRENLIEIDLLESCVRDDLNSLSSRVMVVLNPVKLTITNYPESKVELMKADNNPEDDSAGQREMPFSRNIYVERDDYMENAPRKFYRLSEGRNVRLKHAYIIHCDSVVRDESGNVIEILCTYYPDSKSGEDVSGVKAKGTLHWVSAEQSITCTVRKYDRLFTVPEPLAEEGKDFLDFYNDKSLEINDEAVMEPYLKIARPGDHFQFLRKGYYTLDPDSGDDHYIFNETVSLKSSWSGRKK